MSRDRSCCDIAPPVSSSLRLYIDLTLLSLCVSRSGCRATTQAGGGRALDPVNPKPFLASLVGSPVVVRLKWGMEYRGRLTSTDAYFNVLLGDAEEWVGGAMAGRIGEVLIRYVSCLLFFCCAAWCSVPSVLHTSVAVALTGMLPLCSLPLTEHVVGWVVWPTRPLILTLLDE